MFIFFFGSLQSQVDMRGLSILRLCKKEIRMKPKTAAAHMIISGASLPCRPDPLCVCCENNRHCGCFIPPTRPNLEPHRSEGSGQSSHMHKSHACTHACLECEHAQSSARPGFYAYMCSRTEDNVTLWALKILISAWTAARLSIYSVCLLCWPLSLGLISSPPFVPSSSHFPHLHPFCPLLLYLLLFCSSTCPRRVHLSDPVTLAAGRQIASTPTGHNIALLSALLDQMALRVYQQTQWDSRLQSHEHTHINT